MSKMDSKRIELKDIKIEMRKFSKLSLETAFKFVPIAR